MRASFAPLSLLPHSGFAPGAMASLLPATIAVPAHLSVPLPVDRSAPSIFLAFGLVAGATLGIDTDSIGDHSSAPGPFISDAIEPSAPPVDAPISPFAA